MVGAGLAALTLCVGGCYEGIDDAGGVPWGGADSAGADTELPSNDADGDDSEGSGSSDSATTRGSDDDDSAGSGDGTTGATTDSAGDTAGDDSAGDSAGDETTGEPGDSGDSGDSGDVQTDDVPDNAYCQGVRDWDPAWAAFEQEILDRVNAARESGANCGSEGNFGPAAPLTMDPALRCAARVHSKDMADNNFFDHTNLQGQSPFERMQLAGYSYNTAGENIAGGSSTPAGAMDQWLGSDGHCANMMNPDFEHLGAGYYPGGPYGTSWTQAFGAN